ncbi:MAG: prepilin-type N-terminal cleavage/methylation domain-containing protein [Puniceicoccales bacterium]|nr:prepilin-type N-terminal cleavage/methylation domain-containing protein [Puniceicoccales bacterium]
MKHRPQEGFSLLELLMVSTLLLILVVLVLPPWARMAGRWSRLQEKLRLVEEKERLFWRIQEDWARLACRLDRVEGDLQILGSGTHLILSSRNESGQMAYVLWAREEAFPGSQAVYRSGLSRHSEESMALCDSFSLGSKVYPSFRKMFPGPAATPGILPETLFADRIVSWRIQYAAEGDLSSAGNLLRYGDFPEFFSWRAWAEGDLNLADEPQWLAIHVVLLPPSLQKQWGKLSPESRDAFLRAHGIFGTKLLPFYPCDGA